MSMNGQNFYDPTMKNIYSLLDNLENKLGRYNSYSSYGINRNLNNYKTFQKKQNEFNNNYNTDYDNIKRIIISEFGQLILPYQKDFNSNINSLEAKINSINSKIDNLKDINNNNPKFNNNLIDNKHNFVSRIEFIELQNQISLMNTSISSLRNVIEKKGNLNKDKNIFSSINNFEIKNDNEKKIMEEINKIKETISQNFNMNNIKPNEQLKEYDLKLNNIIQNFKSIKEENSNLNGELSQLKEQINNETQKNLNETNINEFNLNEIKKLNNKIQDLENNMKVIEQNFDSKLINLKNNINDFELKLNEFKIKNIDNKNLNVNNNTSIIAPNEQNNNKMIEDLVQKKLEELNFENKKYLQELNLKYDSKNEQIFKLFEEHNILINNLNLKLEKIKNNIETDNKKKFNHLTEKIEKSMVQINESNIGFNNESRVDTNLIGAENINNMKLQINKQNNALENFEKEIKLELNKIYEQISNYSKRIELIENKTKDDKVSRKKIKEDSSEEDKFNKSKENNFMEFNNDINTNNQDKSKISKKLSKKSSENNGLSIESLLLQDNN